jgi:hypothetical protein
VDQPHNHTLNSFALGPSLWSSFKKKKKKICLECCEIDIQCERFGSSVQPVSQTNISSIFLPSKYFEILNLNNKKKYSKISPTGR